MISRMWFEIPYKTLCGRAPGANLGFCANLIKILLVMNQRLVVLFDGVHDIGLYHMFVSSRSARSVFVNSSQFNTK